MPAAVIHCTECGAALRVAARPAPGKKLKCPKCQSVFVVPPAEEEVQERAPAKPAKARPNGAAPAKVAAKPIPPKRAVEDDEDEAPRKPVKARRAADEEDVDEAPARARRRSDDDEEGFVRRKPKRKAKKSKSNAGMVLGVTVAAILLLILLGGGAVTAFVWPGFLLSGENKGTGSERPLAYIPASHNRIVALRPEALEQLGVLSQVESKMNQGPGDAGKEFLDNLKKEANLSLKDFEVVQISSRLKVALTPLPPPSIGGGPAPRGGPPAAAPPPSGSNEENLLVLKTKAPFKQADVAKVAKDGDKKKHEGKVFYTMKSSQPDGVTTLFMPNNQIIIASNMAEDQFKAVVASDGTQLKVSGGLLSLLQGVEQSSAWFVTTDDQITKPIGPGLAFLAGNLKPDAPSPNALGASVTVDATGANIHITAQFAAADAAKNTADGLQKLLDKKDPAQDAMLKMVSDKLIEDLKTLKVTPDGNQVSVSCQISKASIDALVQFAEKQASQAEGQAGRRFGVGGAGPPPPGQPPPSQPGRGATGRNRGTGSK